MNLLSAFGGGLFIIPLLFLTGIVVFTISGIRSSKSGSKQQTQKGTIYSDKNIPFYKTWQAKFVLGLLIALVIIIIWMYNER